MSIKAYFIPRTMPTPAIAVTTPGRAFILVILLVACELAAGQSPRYVKKYKPLADSLSAVYGIPAAIILGVAIMESGAGGSRNCKLLNNHFGIVGKNNLLRTKGIKTRYKQYPDAQASYMDFCRVIKKKKFYKKLKDNMDYKLWADAISKTGYSEIPVEWKKRVIATIEKNKLSASQ
ncbi:MAG: glucosaminidase domain-containing protein [Bacteroidota bacterium]|nr:glucosaminidase domain-containing protein [Bacteroidota bacterium]